MRNTSGDWERARAESTEPAESNSLTNIPTLFNIPAFFSSDQSPVTYQPASVIVVVFPFDPAESVPRLQVSATRSRPSERVRDEDVSDDPIVDSSRSGQDPPDQLSEALQRVSRASGEEKYAARRQAAEIISSNGYRSQDLDTSIITLVS